MAYKFDYTSLSSELASYLIAASNGLAPGIRRTQAYRPFRLTLIVGAVFVVLVPALASWSDGEIGTFAFLCAVAAGMLIYGIRAERGFRRHRGLREGQFCDGSYWWSIGPAGVTATDIRAADHLRVATVTTHGGGIIAIAQMAIRGGNTHYELELTTQGLGVFKRELHRRDDPETVVRFLQNCIDLKRTAVERAPEDPLSAYVSNTAGLARLAWELTTKPGRPIDVSQTPLVPIPDPLNSPRRPKFRSPGLVSLAGAIAVCVILNLTMPPLHAWMKERAPAPAAR